MTAQTKSVRAGKTEAEPEIRKITLRGVTYVARELNVIEYKECLKAATNENGFTPFQDLLDQMVVKAISPSPAAAKKPLPYPVYRTLEDLVNVMHFVDLKDEAVTDGKNGDEPAGDEEETEGEAPNS